MSNARLQQEIESTGEPESGFAEHVRIVLKMLGVVIIELVVRGSIDILSTLQGADMVSDLLTRLDYGVYT